MGGVGESSGNVLLQATLASGVFDVSVAAACLAGRPGRRGRRRDGVDTSRSTGHTRTGSVSGTVAFMSRQQIFDYKFAKPDVDVWAMAASLYFMLTGRTPRDFPAHADPIAVILREPATPIRDREPSIPPRLAALIDTALVDSPRLAVTSAEEFRAALAHAL
jgi:serine/threonine protein kinase